MSRTQSDPITLDTPVKRGDSEITTLTINKPNSGALRGASLRGLLDFNTNDILIVTPRVSNPTLTPAEAAQLDPADLVQVGAAIADFLLPKQFKDEAAPVDSSLT